MTVCLEMSESLDFVAFGKINELEFHWLQMHFQETSQLQLTKRAFGKFIGSACRPFFPFSPYPYPYPLPTLLPTSVVLKKTWIQNKLPIFMLSSSVLMVIPSYFFFRHPYVSATLDMEICGVGRWLLPSWLQVGDNSSGYFEGSELSKETTSCWSNLLLIYYHTSLLSSLSFLVTCCSSHGYAGISM